MKQYWREAVIILLLGYFVYGVASEKIAEARAQAVSESADRVRKETKAEYDAKIDELEKSLKTVKDLKSAVQVETRYQPLIVPAAEVQRSQITSDVTLPDSPSFSIRSEAQEVEVGKLVIGFEGCKADAKKCESDLKQALIERDEWKKAAKGGSKFKRFLSGTVKVGIGIGIGLALRR